MDLGAQVVEHLCICAPHSVRIEATSKKAIDEKSNPSSTILQTSRKHTHSFNSHWQTNKHRQLRDDEFNIFACVTFCIQIFQT
jgi:hypothetical protein